MVKGFYDKKMVRRYVFFFISILVNAFSIALITKAMLGTSPISSIPLALSLVATPTMGMFTIYFNLLFIGVDLILMTKEEIRSKWYELAMQIPITLVFGSFIDISTYWLLPWLHPEAYLLKVVTLLIGCALLGLGISMEVKANVAMVAGEYLVQNIAKVAKREFAMVKVCFDCSNVVIACAIVLPILGHLEGVREGTVVAALTVGPISHFFLPRLRIFDSLLGISQQSVIPSATSSASYPPVITITRTYCSGGHELGEKLSERLGLKLYDKTIISLAAEESKMTEQYVSATEQRMSSNALLAYILRDYDVSSERNLCPADALFVAQSKVIRRIAAMQPCVIIGRLSDYVLKDYPGPIIRLFCYNSPDDATMRCMREHNCSKEKARGMVERTNRERISHYQYYTGRQWGSPRYYDLMLNTTSIALPLAVDMIATLYNSRVNNFQKKQN